MEIKCRECAEPIEGTSATLDANIVGYHYPECFTKHVESYKEYGIRIGARIHGKKVGGFAKKKWV